jgi:uncharacterized membrane protein YsdA (DUF1294 family)
MSCGSWERNKGFRLLPSGGFGGGNGIESGKVIFRQRLKKWSIRLSARQLNTVVVLANVRVLLDGDI